MKKIIAVAGLGYVGLSMATLLAQNNKVFAVDVAADKIAAVNNRQSPIRDEYIEKFFAEKNLDLTATTDASAAYAEADFVIIAVPTNYDPKNRHCKYFGERLAGFYHYKKYNPRRLR